VTAVLGAVRSLKYRDLLMTMYAAELRVAEACRLRVQDIDSKQMVVRVQGGKDRLTLLAPQFCSALYSGPGTEKNSVAYGSHRR